MSHLFKIGLFLFLICSGSSGFSQISVTPSVGCVPGLTNASFVYLGPPASGLVWNFGDGSATSTLLSPQHSYLNVGAYIVSCVATIGASTQTFTFSVTVHPLPTGSFNYNVAPSGCAPRSATFTGTSGSPNVNFTWSFGDNTIGSGSVIVHSYMSQNSFNPILTIQNTVTGCFASVNAPSPIHVSSLPNLFVTTNPGTYSCTAPFTTSFSANGSSSGSPLAGGLTYNWNFGNSQTATGVTPGNITFQTGVFNVVLTATDNNNCTHSVSTQISAVMPTVSITAPGSVCIVPQTTLNPPVFTVTASSSQTSLLFNMGDGSPLLTFPNPLQLPPLVPNVPSTYTLYGYFAPGLFTITATASQGTCNAIATRTIFVEQITPAYTAIQPSFTCNYSITASFINQSTVNSSSSLTYAWLIEHWNQQGPSSYSSLLANPTFTLTQGSLNPYVIYNPYVPSITMMATSHPLGCIASASGNFYIIQRPTANFSMRPSEGCAPLTVTLTNLSQSFSTTPITSYTWCSNNPSAPGTTCITGAGPNIPDQVFTYTAIGTYSPFLSIQTQSGCASTSYIGTVTVVNPPVISMSLPSNTFCANQSVTVNLSSNNPQPQHWHVISDLGNFSGCVSNPNPSWQFINPGVHSFTVSAYLNSCKTTANPVQTVQIKGPVTEARYETNCTNKLSVKFDYTLKDATSAILNFGESPTSTINIAGAANATVTGNTTFVYAAAGDYTATITGYNTNGCPPSTYTMLVTVRQPTADFTFSPVICKETSQTFTALVSFNNLIGGGTGYVWFINNDPPILTTSSVLGTNSFTSIGIQTVTLRVKDVNGCVDKKTQLFRVAAPIPTFTFNYNPICFSDYPLQLFNQTPQSPDAVTNFTWSYGAPGVPFPQTFSIVNSTATQTYNFNLNALSTQTFSIKLTAKDAAGCIDSLRHVIQVNNPFAYYYTIQNRCTPGPNVNFTFLSQPTYTNYFISFNNGSPSQSSAANTATSSYQTPGVYTPTLIVTDNAGCKATWTQSFEVQTYPVSNFTYVNTLSNLTATAYCLPVTLSLTSTSSFTSPVYYIWDLGIPPVSPPNQNTTAGTSYTAAGTYTLKLTLMNATAPCVNTKSLVINLYDKPIADAEINKNPFCLGDVILVTIKNPTAVHHWQWDFGDSQPTATLSAPSLTTFPYTYTFFPASTNGTFQIILTSYSPGEVCKDIKTIDAKVVRVIPGFKRNNELSLADYAHCLGLTDTFSNTTTSNASVLSYTWNFGDGSSAFQLSPNHLYQIPGNFTVNLIAKDFNVGCTNDVSKTMTVYPSPSASISVEDLACPDSLFLVQGGGLPGLSGALSGTVSSPQSNFPVSFNANNTFSLTATAPVTTVFTLNVTDNNGCKNTPVTDTIHIQLPPPTLHTSTTVIIGQTVSINAFAGSNYTYTWTPLVTDLNYTTNPYYPVSSSTVNITYSVTLIDQPLACFERVSTHDVIVQLVASLDVPTAFTPNGDGTNDVIYPGGWGIRKLIYFKIFNRWGQLIFESNDINIGWDGTFNGVPQNMETYVYQVSVDAYTNETLNKTGTFKLIR